MIRKPLIILLPLVLASCGISAKVDARNDMEQSKATYKTCLANNPNNIPACDGARLAYEADVKAYRTLSAGIHNGTDNTMNINTSTGQ